MNNYRSKRSVLALAIAAALVILVALPVSAGGFARGVVVLVEDDGTEYYLAGEPVGLGSDVPGHYWVKAGPNQVVGKHYNTGPLGSPFEEKGWSSDAPDGELLYIVHGIIDTWTLA